MTGDHPVRTIFRLTFAIFWSKFWAKMALQGPAVLAHSYLTMANFVFQRPKRLPATQTARKRWPPELKSFHRVHPMRSTYSEIFGRGGHRFVRETPLARPKMTHFRPFGPIWGKTAKRPFGDLKSGDACGFWGRFCSNVNFLALAVRSMPEHVLDHIWRPRAASVRFCAGLSPVAPMRCWSIVGPSMEKSRLSDDKLRSNR
jgi:hypothetical protein